MVIDDRFKLFPVSQLSIVRLGFFLQDWNLTCNTSEIILEMIDNVFDLSQNLLCLVELWIQNAYLLINSQEVSDAVIL
jgi:hypothetical protein